MTSAADSPGFTGRAWRWPDRFEDMRGRFAAAQPYPHIVVDGLFDPEVLGRLYADIPSSTAPVWTHWGGGKPEDCEPQNKKRGISDLAKLPASISSVLEQLLSAEFIGDLCAIAGVSELVTDRTLSGGGLHCSGRGAALRLHADPIRHPSPAEFDQALNLILYISPDWIAEYEGHLELWSRDCSERVLSIPPLFNRMVMFRADRTTYHGHPRPNNCPEGTWRASLALYYYIRRPQRVELESNRPIWR